MWLFIALAGAIPAGSTASAKIPQADSFICASITQSDVCPLAESGWLGNLRWPDFRDVRTDVRDFYLPFDYALAWTKGNRPTSQAIALIRLLQDADDKGLRAEDYDGPFWNDRIARLAPPAQPSSSDLARFDLALTVSVMRYISALHNGRVNPRRLQIDLNVENKKYKLADFIRQHLVAASDVDLVLKQVEPSYAGYWRTLAALKRYLELALEGEGLPLPAFRKTIKPGDAYSGLPQLAERLERMGDLTEADFSGEIYQGPIVEAVKHFQQRNGLAATGSIDQGTFKELTTPFSRRVVQIQMTLERWRWLPPDLAGRLIVVNVPEFQLRAYNDHRSSLAMRVVVGRAFPEHQTSVFEDQMEYLIFRPSWNVPISITRKEIIPALKKTPQYLKTHEFEVVNRKGQVVEAEVSNPSVLAKLYAGDLAVRQKPGPGNSLGLIKFVFPNNYDVYLHGTPERALFSRSHRAYSHGCIRVEDPAMLAAWVLHDDASWTTASIQKAMNATESKRVDLLHPIPVLVLYGTALVDESGETHFYDDIYGQDKKLERALSNGYPYPH